jgi:hypothetical protein
MNEVHGRWKNEFGTSPATNVTVARLSDKFEAHGAVQNTNKGCSGRSRSSNFDGGVETMLQTFTQSPSKSVRQYSRDTGVHKTSSHCILRSEKWKP